MFENLNSDEREIVDMIATRIAKGRETYGPMNLNTDRRDMLKETIEEVLDALVYSAAALIKLRRLSSREEDNG